MKNISRRRFTQLAGGVALSTLAMPSIARAAQPKVVVIGGGAGGATAARYISNGAKGAIDVTLIEPTKTYYTCFFSNLYVGGFRDYASIGHSYSGLAREGINVVHDWAENIDRDKKEVRPRRAPGALRPPRRFAWHRHQIRQRRWILRRSVLEDAACLEIRARRSRS
jgi:sulfide dehydrogenase [flavocytochrome c] flavoprotein subunit